jgi:phage gp29-like protein
MGVTLYDAAGRVVDLEALKQPQAAPEFVGVRNIFSNLHPTVGLTPERLNAVLLQAEQGDPYAYFELAQDMEERDTHLMSVLSTRKQTVAQLELMVKPADSSPEAGADAGFVRELLLDAGGMSLQSSFVDILDAIGKGVSVQEIDWDSDGDGLGVRWLPRRIEWRDPRWFMFDWISGEQLLVRTYRTDGQTLPSQLAPGIRSTPEGAQIGIQPMTAPLAPFKFVAHLAKAKSGIPIRGGLARAISWIYLFKKLVMKDAAVFSERFGMPARRGKFGPGATKEDKELLLRATAALGSDAAVILPESMDIELVVAQGGGNRSGVAIYETLLRYYDSAMSKAVLGQDFTTELPKQGGSRAAAQVGKDVRDGILRWDATRLAETLTRDLVRPAIDLNRGPRRRYPSISLKILGAVDARAFMDAAATAADHGVDVGQNAVREVLGIPAPTPGEKLLTPRQVVRVTEDTIAPDPIEGNDPAPLPKPTPATVHAAAAGSEPPEPQTALRKVSRAVIIEGDRVWIMTPAAEPYTMLPGGGCDTDSMRAAAIREAREETGLEIRITRWLADFVDEFSWRRYYVAERIGGQPSTRDADGGGKVIVERLPFAEAMAKLTSPFDRAALAMVTPEKLRTTAAVYREVREAYDRARSLNDHARRRRRNPRLPLEGYAQAMARDWQPVLGPMIDPIRQAIGNARDLPDAKRRLAIAADEMGMDVFVDRLARAGFNARMAARHKVALPEE